MIIRARAPLRIGLAGGGTDVSPFCDEFGGLVLNTTIDRYAYATITLRADQEIHFFSSDKGCRESYAVSSSFGIEGSCLLLKATYLHMIKNYNSGNIIALDLCTFCDSPPGSGLGSSSTLVVAIVKAFSGLLDLYLDNYVIAEIAHTIERVECSLLGGRQDHYSAVFGGFNFIEFNEGDKVVVNPLILPQWIIQELEASLILFFTGVSRDSDRIIADQSANMINKDKGAMNALHGIKKESLSMKMALLRGDFSGIVQSMKTGWANKKKSSSVISNPFIETIYSAAIDSGALAGKVSGAGGGGFMIFFVPLDKRKQVIDTLSSFDGELSNTHFTDIGARFWKTE